MKTKNQEQFEAAISRSESLAARSLFESHPNDIDIHVDDDFVFRNRAMHGDMAFMQWLLHQDPATNIHAHDDDAYVQALAHHQYHVAMWLQDIDPDYDWASVVFLDDLAKRRMDMAREEPTWKIITDLWIGV